MTTTIEKTKTMVAEVEQYLDDLTDAEDIFITALKRKLRTSSALLSENENKRLANVKAKPKYKNIKVMIDGLKFDSMKEGKRYYELKLMQEKGLIEDLKIHEPFRLVDAVRLDGRKKPAIRYFADFVYMLPQSKTMVVEDVKSEKTRKLRAYRDRKHMMMAFYGIEITEI